MTDSADNARDVLRLVHDARRGGEGALTELYRRYSEMVFEVAFRLTESAADAADVMQEVFIALPDATGEFEGGEQFERWLRGVTTRLTVNQTRQHASRGERPLAALGREILSGAQDPPEFIEALTLERAIAGLPSEWRVVFVLREVHGYSHDEIAEMVGISATASWSRLHRAVRRLRSVLGRQS